MTTDIRFRRGVVVLLAAALALSVAAPALGATTKRGKHNFEHGKDTSSWFWQKQQDQEVTTPEGVTLPVPVSQRVRLPSPQRPDTLPVAINNSEPERMAAVKFELTERGVTEGSSIKKMVLVIQESQDRNENPQYRADIAKIQACRITDSLSPGDGEQWKDAPKFAEDGCVAGKRDGATEVPSWTFDLTKISDPWGKNPYDNNGVMLVPVDENKGLDETWQVNLKVPSLDDAATPADEYEQTKTRAVIELEFVPGKPTALGTTDTSVPPVGSTGTTGGSTFPSSSTGSPVTGSTDLAGGGEIPGADAAPETAPTEQAGLATPFDQGPRMPAYVWLLIPLGLLALSAVRSVVLEPAGGPRPDGVISAIRRRNAERRGAPASESNDLLTRMTGAMSRGASGTRKAFSTLARKVRRR